MAGRLTMSGLARAKACPASVALPQAGTSSRWSDEGHGRHSIADDAIRSGDREMLPAEVAELLEPGTVAKSELAFAYDVGASTARFLDLEGARAYDVGPSELPGTMDLLILRPSGRPLLLDYKGFEDVGDPSANDQILGYALGVSRLFGAAELDVAVAYIQESNEGTLELLRPLQVREVDAIDLDAHAARIRAIVKHVDYAREVVAAGAVPDVREGPHCKYCPAIPHCPAKQQTLVRLATSREEADLLRPLGDLTPEVAGLAWERVVAAEQLVKRVKSQIMALAAHTRIPLPDGRVLGHLVEPGNREIDASLAYEVLHERYGAAIADAAIEESTSQAAIERALKGQVPSVAGAMKAVLAELERRRGIQRKQKTVIKPRPPEDYEVAPAKKAS